MQPAQLVGEAVLTFYRVRDSSMGWATDRMHQERRGLQNHLLSNGFNQHLMPKPPRRMRHLPCSSLKMIPVLGSITWLPQIRLIYESGQIFFFLCVLFVVDGYELTVEVTLAAPPHLSTVLRWVVP